MENIALSAIEATEKGILAFCKFLSANDTGETGGHQAGIYMAKPAVPILFDRLFEKGSNQEKWVKIKWQDDFETDSRFIYYGRGTRNEYRITNFGRGFPFLRHDYTGSLFVLVKLSEEYYRGYILSSEEEIEQFLGRFNLSPTETNNLISLNIPGYYENEQKLIDDFAASVDDFPASEVMSAKAREIENQLHNHQEYIVTAPDKKIIAWTDMEYKLFRAVEQHKYGDVIRKGFEDFESFVSTANHVLNRRKSRAGKSLEHHLSAIFDGNNLSYTYQALTEGRKKPDFIFPSQRAYHSVTFPVENLISLAAKTTCKDRWRQILNEADRLRGRTKFLCTLQQGISAAQLDEMREEQVILVVPKPYIQTYPKSRQNELWTLKKFVDYVKETERT